LDPCYTEKSEAWNEPHPFWIGLVRLSSQEFSSLSPFYFTHSVCRRGIVESATCKKELLIEIPPDVVEREAESVVKEYAKLARIPGFRPGHAPREMVRRRFRDEIKSDVVQALVPQFFKNAVKDQKLAVVGEPRFEELKFEEKQPLSIKATFEVYPEIALGEYKGLEVEQEPATVADSDVEKALEEMRQSAATFEAVEDRPAEDDDYVVASYRGRDAADPKSEPVELREGMIHLGGKGTLSGFTENLRGSRAGEIREFEVTYPEEFPGKKVAGKTIRYRVEVLGIKKKSVPALDDELAKTVSAFQTLDELRAQVRGDLGKRRQEQVESETRTRLVKQLEAAHPFPVPEALVEQRLDRKFQRLIAELMAQGVDPRTAPMDWREIRVQMRPEAEKEVRGFLILGKIAEAEKIEVTEEELDEAIREMAEGGDETPAALKTRLTRDNELDTLKSSRRNVRALDLVYANAKIIQKMSAAGNEPKV